MNNCGTAPLFVPTTINALVRNLDAVDVAATSVSCTNLTINGNPVSNVFQNIGESTVGQTTFTGNVKADSLTSNGAITAQSVTSTSTSVGVLNSGSITNTGSISTLSIGAGTVVATGDVSGATLTGTVATPTQNSITKIGTQTSFATSGNISQTGGSTTLLSTTASSLTVRDSTSTGTTALVQVLEPNQTSGYAQVVLGKSTTTNNAGVLSFGYTSSGAATNGLSMANYNGACSVTVNGSQALVATSASNAAPLAVTNTGATSTTQLGTFYAPNQTSGRQDVVIGKEFSANNSGLFSFVYNSLGSPTNNIRLALHSSNNGVVITRDDTTVIGNLSVTGTVSVGGGSGKFVSVASALLSSNLVEVPLPTGLTNVTVAFSGMKLSASVPFSTGCPVVHLAGNAGSGQSITKSDNGTTSSKITGTLTAFNVWNTANASNNFDTLFVIDGEVTFRKTAFHWVITGQVNRYADASNHYSGTVTGSFGLVGEPSSVRISTGSGQFSNGSVSVSYY